MSDASPDDQLPVRPVQPWTADKLAILGAYLPRFTRACRGKARHWYYVDGFAGPGVNEFPDGARMWGSPMLAVTTEPPFSGCLLMDTLERNVRALEARADAFGDRATVRRGEMNADLLPMMAEVIVDRHAPILCLLDPEGVEVNWATVQQLSRFRIGRYKTELLMLFPTEALPRVAPLWSVGPNPEESRRFFGNDRWVPIMERRLADEITAGEARTEYLRLYDDGLRGLGYKTVLNRNVLEREPDGRPKYSLVFATDNPAGENIMDWCFKKIRPRATQGVLFADLEPPTGRDV